MADKIILQTKLGKLSIEKNSNNKYPGVFIKLNNTPILLIEENEDKIMVKNYENKNTVIDDDYINLDYYDININEINFEEEE